MLNPKSHQMQKAVNDTTKYEGCRGKCSAAMPAMRASENDWRTVAAQFLRDEASGWTQYDRMWPGKAEPAPDRLLRIAEKLDMLVSASPYGLDCAVEKAVLAAQPTIAAVLSDELQWHEAAGLTVQWGAGMMVADVALSADETLTLYAHKDALHLVSAELAAQPIAQPEAQPDEEVVQRLMALHDTAADDRSRFAREELESAIRAALAQRQEQTK